MNAMHLVWIIPAAVVGGFILGAVLAAGNPPAEQQNPPRDECYCITCPFNPGQNNDIV